MNNTYENWRKASYSNGSGQCVEAASSAGTVAVRDTANRGGGTLAFSTEDWERFTASVRRGKQFNTSLV
jgi:hypothetical protein